MKTKNGKLLAACFMLVAGFAMAQITAAKITYERKTNLFKKFKEHDVEDWMKEEDKIKLEYFELFITDTASVFKPQESDLKESFSWATNKNTVLQDFKRHSNYTIKSMWGEELHLTDSLIKQKWQITEYNRKIAGYLCRKAYWQANDSTRIYAWFSYDLTPSTGPESFNGLPGTILGLATEDGGIVYFAKKVDLLKIPATVFVLPKKKKIYTVPELKAQMTKEYGKEKWFKKMMDQQFGIW